jgi:nitrate reductase gamma subunit
MRVLFAFIIVLLLALAAYAGVEAGNLRFLFGVVIPYVAVLVFITGMIYRVLKWGSAPVPFRIPTTCGQQKSLPWIKQSKLENPSTMLGVIGRMTLEVLFFRSLFRNLKTQLHEDSRLAYGEAKWLWLAGMAFHWSFLTIFARHLRFVIQQVPQPIRMIEGLDSFLQIGTPLLYMTDVVLLLAVAYLFIRRVGIPQMRYLSLANDYFPLFLIFGIGLSGVLMRYFYKTDIVSVKVLAMGLVSFKPSIPEGIGVIFYIHFFLLCVLLIYFPFSKLAHLGGVFMSPTRNLANNNRMKRHINPWNYPVHVHTYAEYEDEFREKMKKAGLPVEKE